MESNIFNYLLIIILIILLIVFVIVCIVKFPKYRMAIISGLLVVTIVTIGYLEIHNYVANRWLHPLEESIKKEYDFVESIRFSTPDSVSVCIDCYFGYQPDDHVKKAEQVFEKIKAYITSEEGMKQMEQAGRSRDNLASISIIFNIDKKTHYGFAYISENPPNFTEWKRSLQDGPWDD